MFVVNQKTRTFKFLVWSVAFYFPPLFVFAKTIEGVLDDVKSQLTEVPALLLGIAIILFMYAVFKRVIAKGEKEVSEATQMIVWGLIGLFVIVAVAGLVGAIKSTFGL